MWIIVLEVLQHEQISETVFWTVQVYHCLKGVIKKKYGMDACNVGDEGGFAPNIQENKEGLQLLVEAINKAGYTGKIKIGMDVAASEFYKVIIMHFCLVVSGIVVILDV
jgi:enolase